MINAEVIALIEQFCHTFDEKDWEAMAICLADQLDVDYSSFRGTPPEIIKADDYIQLRKVGLAALNTVHQTTDYQIINTDSLIKCRCAFAIKRFTKDKTKYFHSYGTYEFTIVSCKSGLKISGIRQELAYNEGTPNIHGAFKTPK